MQKSLLIPQRYMTENFPSYVGSQTSLHSCLIFTMYTVVKLRYS